VVVPAVGAAETTGAAGEAAIAIATARETITRDTATAARVSPASIIPAAIRGGSSP
jgi:hypothetical protein